MSFDMFTPPTKQPTLIPLWNWVSVSASLAIWYASSRVGESTRARMWEACAGGPRRTMFSMVGMRKARVCGCVSGCFRLVPCQWLEWFMFDRRAFLSSGFSAGPVPVRGEWRRGLPGALAERGGAGRGRRES